MARTKETARKSSSVVITPAKSNKRKYTKRQPTAPGALSDEPVSDSDSSATESVTHPLAFCSFDGHSSATESVTNPKVKVAKEPKEKKEKAVKEPKEKKEKAVKEPKEKKEKVVEESKENEKVVETPNELTGATCSTQFCNDVTGSDRCSHHPNPLFGACVEVIVPTEFALIEAVPVDFPKTVISKEKVEKVDDVIEPKVDDVIEPKEKKEPKVKAVKEPKEKKEKAVKEPKEKKEKAVKEPNEKKVKAVYVLGVNVRAVKEPKTIINEVQQSEISELGLELSEDENGEEEIEEEEIEEDEDELVVTEKIWMGKMYLVDENSGNMYDVATEKLIPEKHWDGFNVIMKSKVNAN